MGIEASSLPYCIVGLGNPGKNYEKTRHNMGFLFLDFLAKEYGLSWEKKKNYHLAKKEIQGKTIFFLKPHQFMNLSGYALREVLSYYKIPNKQALVCYDDTAFKIGDLRLKAAGGAGGHNGLSSIIEQLHSNEVPRLRLGIAPLLSSVPIILDQFVLSSFNKEELSLLPALFVESKTIIESFIQKGIDKTMSIANFR